MAALTATSALSATFAAAAAAAVSDTSAEAAANASVDCRREAMVGYRRARKRVSWVNTVFTKTTYGGRGSHERHGERGRQERQVSHGRRGGPD